MTMHPLQQKLLDLIKDQNISKMSFRQIGKLIGEPHPQKISHHLSQLQKKGLIKEIGGKTEKVFAGKIKNSEIVSVPIYGMSNCSSPTCLADEYLEGYLKVSKRLLNQAKDIFAVKARGNSMNKAAIAGKAIDDGDYVIIDSEDKVPRNGDYVLMVIDEVSCIKRIFIDEPNNQIILISESSEDHPPIYLHPSDKFIVNGKIKQVIKKPEASWV